METLLLDLKSFNAKIEEFGLAGQSFRSQIDSIIQAAEASCPPDFPTSLIELKTISEEIRAAREKLAELRKQRNPFERRLLNALEKNKTEKAEQLQIQLNELDAEILLTDGIANQIHPDQLESFEKLFLPYIGETCPENMTYIDGTFCIDVYEYPNEKGAIPIMGTSFMQAEKSCEEIGKRICSGEEWMRVCKGHSCRPNFLAISNYKPSACFAGTDLLPGTPAKPAGSAPETCDTPEGVADMLGNAWEWTTESFVNEYKVVQGGTHSKARAALCTNRTAAHPAAAKPYFGFRCCKDPALPPPPPEPEIETESAEEGMETETHQNSPALATGTMKL